MTEIHHLPAFKDWYSKVTRTQPSGTVQKDFSMVCWIVSYSGRIPSVDKSFESWTNNYLKFRTDVVVTEEDKVLFGLLFDKYNMKTGEELGLGDIANKRCAQFVTDHAGNGDYDREFMNTWTSQAEAAN